TGRPVGLLFSATLRAFRSTVKRSATDSNRRPCGDLLSSPAVRAMTDKKTWGSTVAGWFVVHDQPQGSDATEDDAIRAAATAPPLDVFTSAPPAAKGGKVEFEQVFDAAGIEAAERERVSRTLDLLNSLPPGTDETVKKQIVMASLRAFGVPVEQIVEATAQQLQALEAYIRGGASD